MRAKGLRRGLVTAGALVLGLAVAVSSWAQGMFYKEIKKDGRIYVFNDAKRAEAFEKSGRDGHRPHARSARARTGETVFADSETALELFFFKHGISQVVERPKPPVQTIVWRDGKTRFTLGNNFYMEMSNRIQPRFTYEMPDDSVQLPGTGGPGRQQGQLPHPPRQVQARGLVLQARARVRAAAQLARRERHARPASFLEDANIDWDISKKKTFRVRFGQFKAPYGRQQLTSSGAQQFVDRADHGRRATTRAARRASRSGAPSAATSSTGA